MPRHRLLKWPLLGVPVLLAGVLVVAFALVGGTSERAHAEHPMPVEVLARSNFPDDIRALVQMRLEDSPRFHTALVRDASDIVVAKVTLHPGDAVPWHTHPGPAFVAIAEGVLTITHAMDCVPRPYAEGEAFLDIGFGNRADNFGTEDVVAYVAFIGIPAGEPATTLMDDPGC